MCDFIGWSTCDSNCSSWGNYGDVTSAEYTGYHSEYYTSTWVYSEKDSSGSNCWIFPTGKFVNEDGGTTEKKNIFDVAGNVWEWTTEVSKYSESNRVLRGGSALNLASNDLAASRDGGGSGDTYTNYHVGFRIVLYVE